MTAGLARLIMDIQQNTEDDLIVRRLRLAADTVDKYRAESFKLSGEKDEKKPPKEVEKDIKEVFAYWHKANNKTAATKLSKKRVGIIRGRLKEFSKDALFTCIDWCAGHRWYSTQSIDYIFKNYEMTDGLIAKSGWKPAEPGQSDELRDLERQAKLAYKDGKVEEYKELQSRIEKRRA